MPRPSVPSKVSAILYPARVPYVLSKTLSLSAGLWRHESDAPLISPATSDRLLSGRPSRTCPTNAFPRRSVTRSSYGTVFPALSPLRYVRVPIQTDPARKRSRGPCPAVACDWPSGGVGRPRQRVWPSGVVISMSRNRAVLSHVARPTRPAVKLSYRPWKVRTPSRKQRNSAPRTSTRTSYQRRNSTRPGAIIPFGRPHRPSDTKLTSCDLLK